VSDALVARLSGRKGLTPAQIRTAARFASLAAEAATPLQGPALEALIERQLRNADAALGKAATSRAVPTALRSYALDWLNVECRYEIPRVVDALKTRGHGSLCFYGPPGSGKTALAEHLAQALGRPLLVRQASDLLSKYLGETEQNMAAMFREAESEGAVLLLDEADSFLQDRRGAQRSYEVSEVNEMLQGMERFRGIFVCTTNLMDRLDPAALRRFSFKIQFGPLTAAQREAVFMTESGLAPGALPLSLATRLAALDQLCLGDFAAVLRQADILGDALDPLALLEQLEAEHRIKPEVRERRAIGFVH
jgi:SpoVK/Ycf46/Vps4 family AAA+-type ATPase